MSSSNRFARVVLIILGSLNLVYAQPGKCDQTPPGATVLTPSEGRHPYTLGIKTKIETSHASYGKFLPDQTYVLILETTDYTLPFKDFMITAEDPEVDNNIYHFEHQKVDVGTLKTLDDDFKSRYSERCFSSVENKDNSDKYRIEMHWVSPKVSEIGQKIRFRAMVAQNKEVWYTGPSLTITLMKDDATPLDSPPFPPNEFCNLCSEARYEVIFKGIWSRGTHSLHYPSKPDDNKYSHMVGASHDINYVLWAQGAKAGPGIKQLAEEANTTLLEQSIVTDMSETDGTRTLIKGKMHQHPHMSEPSHALFRVDKIHHLFSVAIAMRPSPDWFLGTSRFELCTSDGWLPSSEIPLYPWDAGTVDGISYDSPRSMTAPEDNVDRVAVGSFNKESPFYQMNLNDLKPFALLKVKKLDEYPLMGIDCNKDEDEGEGNENKDEGEPEGEEDANDEPLPLVAESRMEEECSGVWSKWSSCNPHDSVCGGGTQTRTRFREITGYYENDDPEVLQVKSLESCHKEQETRFCFINCY